MDAATANLCPGSDTKPTARQIVDVEPPEGSLSHTAARCPHCFESFWTQDGLIPKHAVKEEG